MLRSRFTLTTSSFLPHNKLEIYAEFHFDLYLKEFLSLFLWDHCNEHGSGLFLGLKLNKNIQGFYVGNSHLMRMMFCLYNFKETRGSKERGFIAHVFMHLYYGRLSHFQIQEDNYS